MFCFRNTQHHQQSSISCQCCHQIWSSFLRCPQETQCTAGLSFDGTIMEYADDEHCDLLSTLFAVMVELVLMHVNTWYGIQDYVIERLM